MPGSLLRLFMSRKKAVDYAFFLIIALVSPTAPKHLLGKRTKSKTKLHFSLVSKNCNKFNSLPAEKTLG